MYDDEMRTCIVKDCSKRGVYFARKKAAGPFCMKHCAVWVGLPIAQKDLIEVHQALGDPIDETFALWNADDGGNNRINLENVRIK